MEYYKKVKIYFVFNKYRLVLLVMSNDLKLFQKHLI